MVITNDDLLAERLRMLRVHGSKKRYYHETLGTNSRLDSLRAAVLRVKLRYSDNWTEGRQHRADRYRERFAGLNLAPQITPPPRPSDEFHHIYNQFTIRCQSREELKTFFRQNGVPTEIYYPLCLHLQRAFSNLGYEPGDFPVAEEASREVLSLPAYPELTEEQQDRVVESIAEFYSRS